MKKRVDGERLGVWNVPADVGNLKCQPQECLCYCVDEGELWEDKKLNDESWAGQRLIW